MTLPKLANLTLFDATDLIVVKRINDLSLTGREKWDHEDFRPIYRKIKQILLTSQRQICYYCQKNLRDIDNDDWHIDHIVSIDEDDRHVFTEKNLVLACKWCNRRKNDKSTLVKKLKTKAYSESSANYYIVHPRLDNYFDHIEIFSSIIYTGKTSKGERTCFDCNLKRFWLNYISGIKSEDRAFTELVLHVLTTADRKLFEEFIKSYL
ncbi:HNH endonuclease [Deinococcus roseus]|uniref:HNH endonuclease n=1 Tax=Deinococcus roseus TaxID=392414 RepID=UPI0016634D9B|nr:HNH endonuclease signature motif containing protein [Deinococcus roseus]